MNEAHYIQVNHIVGKLSENMKVTEDTIKKAEIEFMLDLKSLISRTAIDPELTRVRASMRREDRETIPDGYRPVYNKMGSRIYARPNCRSGGFRRRLLDIF